MKKFTSILCALAIVLSASAAPILRAEKVASLSKTEKIEKKVAKQAFVGVKAIKEAKAEKVAFKHIRKAKAEATNVTIGSIGSSFYEEDNDVYYMLLDEAQETAYSFDIVCAEGSQDVELGKTYTLEDMIADYSTWGNPTYVNYGYGTAYTAATFKKTLDANDKVVIEATITDENGAEFNLRYDEALAPEAPQGGTFVADNVSNVYEDGEIQYALKVTDAKLVFYFDIVLAEGKDVVSGHEYTEADLNMQYSAVVFNNITAFSIATATFVKTVAEDGSYTIAAVIVDTEDNTWNITGSKAAPQISEKTLTLEGTYEEGSYMNQIEAKNEAETEYVSLIIFDELAEGSLTEEDLYYPTVTLGTEGVDQVVYDIQEANLTVVYDSDAGAYIISGTMKGVNEDDDLDIVNFTVTLTIAAPAPAEPEEVVELPEGAEIIEYTMDFTAPATSSDAAHPDAKAINVAVVGDKVYFQGLSTFLPEAWVVGTKEGNTITFAGNQFMGNYEDELPAHAFYSGAAVFVYDQEADTYTAEGEIFGVLDASSWGYNLLYDGRYVDPVLSRAKEPDFEHPFEVVATKLDFKEYNSQYKDVIYTLSNATNDTIFAFDIYLANPSDVIPGETYTLEDMETSSAYTYVQVGGVKTSLKTVEFVKTVDDEGLARIEATVVDMKVNVFHVVYQEVKTETAIENANAAAKAVKRIENGQIVIEKNGVRYNVLGAEMK